MVTFYKLFKAGNPLIDPSVKTTPGLVDLCYSGVDLPDDDYTVFRRNKMRYIDIKRIRNEKKKKTVFLKKNLKVDKKKIKKDKKEKEAKRKEERKAEREEEKDADLGKWAKTLKTMK
jgi:hypothetical protein